MRSRARSEWRTHRAIDSRARISGEPSLHGRNDMYSGKSTWELQGQNFKTGFELDLNEVVLGYRPFSIEHLLESGRCIYMCICTEYNLYIIYII